MKRKRYTEDLEFRISEDDDSDNDSSVPKSPSSASQQQVHDHAASKSTLGRRYSHKKFSQMLDRVKLYLNTFVCYVLIPHKQC